LDFGHAAFFGIGAYVAAKVMIERPELEFGLVCVVSAAAALIAALLVGCTVFRLQGHFLALATLGVGEIVHTLATKMKWTGGANGLPGIPVAVAFGVELNTTRELYWLGLALVGAAWALATFLTIRRPGRAMMSIRDDELAARSSGITPFWWKQLAFGTAAGMAGVAGAYFAAVFAFVGPDSFDLEASILLVEMVLLGGLGSHAGSLLGATVFVAGQTLLVTNVPSLGGRQALVIGVAVLLFVVWRPQGIMGRPFVRSRS
jgi:branched-chain amino acid transport system permease protein